MYSNEEQSILNICRYKCWDFLCKKNVVGIGMGYKVTKGITTNKLCIQVFVTKKYPLCQISKKNIIPNCYESIQTDVIESGYFKALQLTDRVRPVPGGYSVGPSSLPIAGSLSCVVTDKKFFYILGCNHIFTNGNLLPISTPILQPSIYDGGVLATDIVATLSKYIPLKFLSPTETPVNFADAALAKVTIPNEILPQIAILGQLSGIAFSHLGTVIQKAGRSTGYTSGIVTTLGASFVSNLPDGRKALMLNQVLCNIKVAGGDSGALALDSNNFALGQIINGSDNMAAFTPITTILNLFSVDLVISY